MVAVFATVRFRFLCVLQGAGVIFAFFFIFFVFAASPKRQETTWSSGAEKGGLVEYVATADEL
jgi:hypothetical protein